MVFFILVAFVLFIFIYRTNAGDKPYKFITNQVSNIYNKYAPYSFKSVTESVKKMGLTYNTRQYTIQIAVFASASFVITYLYFYNIIISIIYATIAVLVIPYLVYLRYKRIYSEYIFEQIQVYTTNVIMEYQTTKSFVKALEGVYESGILNEPVKSDVKTMIDMSYQYGDIGPSIEYMNKKYDYYMVRNMHQMFLQVTQEGAQDIKKSLDNMLLDIDMLVETVYRDRMDRKAFHGAFIRYGIMLFFMIMLVQYLISLEAYLTLLEKPITKIILHAVVIFNSVFLVLGEKYYNENVGVE